MYLFTAYLKMAGNYLDKITRNLITIVVWIRKNNINLYLNDFEISMT